ncbi:MAG: cytochrome o ubiquinol oxidase subunit IV [Parcubacteria bacterium C7867-007]|nr:MAG: cytochrome o ubiquinol oxidase subunit IV [Parcubacteria bacterium C7867-007]
MTTPTHDIIPHGTLSSYVIGFILSIGLTLLAFWVAPTLGLLAVPAIVITALIQLFVQLIFFLHMGSESKPRWNLLIFVLTGVIMAIVIVGTLWIMSNLEELHMHGSTEFYEGGVVSPEHELH